MLHLNSLLRLFTLIGLAVAIVILASSQASPVFGDTGCKSDTPCGVVQGFSGNRIADGALGATIAGGGEPNMPNLVMEDFGTVAGGIDNIAGSQASIAGGAGNRADGYRSAIGGGSGNVAHAAYSTVSGGTGNSATNLHTTVGGGIDNSATDLDATVAGGSGNVASFMLATVGGGAYNTASSLDATVAGGDSNTASGAFSTIAGGSGNNAAGFDTAIGGGSGNYAAGDESTVAGGLTNRTTDKYSTVSGGYSNIAGNSNDSITDSWYSTVGGGSTNRATGAYSTVPGGSSNTAAANYSLAAGHRALVDPAHVGAILFADSQDANFTSTAANEFAVRATGGIRLVTAIDALGNPAAGVRLAPGGGAWEVMSDRNAKTNFESVNGQQVLAELASLPISTWSYKAHGASARHIGPMAQDWSRLGLGQDDRYINTLDETGVALVSIQALYETVQKQDAELGMLREQNAAQQAQLASLDARVSELEHTVAGEPVPLRSDSGSLLFIGLGAGALAVLVTRRF